MRVPKGHPDFDLQVNRQMDRARAKGYIGGRHAQTTPERFKQMLMEGGIIRIPCMAQNANTPTLTAAKVQEKLRKGLDVLITKIEAEPDKAPQEWHLEFATEFDSGHMQPDLHFLYQKLGHVCALVMRGTPAAMDVARYVVDNYIAITENDAACMKRLNELTKLLETSPNES